MTVDPLESPKGNITTYFTPSNYLILLSPSAICTSHVTTTDKYLYLDKHPGLLSYHPVNTHWTLGPSSSWHTLYPNVSDEIWIPWSQCSQLWKPIISQRAGALLYYVTGGFNWIIRKLRRFEWKNIGEGEDDDVRDVAFKSTLCLALENVKNWLLHIVKMSRLVSCVNCYKFSMWYAIRLCFTTYLPNTSHNLSYNQTQPRCTDLDSSCLVIVADISFNKSVT